MKRMDTRRRKGKEKGGQSSTKYEREMKKLEWTVIDRKRKGGGLGRGRRSFAQYCLLTGLKILSWNVRGANDPEKRKIIKAFLKSQRVDVVFLQETKLKDISRGMIRHLGVGRFLD